MHAQPSVPHASIREMLWHLILPFIVAIMAGLAVAVTFGFNAPPLYHPAFNGTVVYSQAMYFGALSGTATLIAIYGHVAERIGPMFTVALIGVGLGLAIPGLFYSESTMMLVGGPVIALFMFGLAKTLKPLS